MDRVKIMAENRRALEMAGLIPAHNTGLGNTITVPAAAPSLSLLTESSDPRLAAAAVRKVRELNHPQEADPSLYELPEESVPLDHQEASVRRSNAVDLTKDPIIPDSFEYGG